MEITPIFGNTYPQQYQRWGGTLVIAENVVTKNTASIKKVRPSDRVPWTSGECALKKGKGPHSYMTTRSCHFTGFLILNKYKPSYAVGIHTLTSIVLTARCQFSLKCSQVLFMPHKPQCAWCGNPSQHLMASCSSLASPQAGKLATSLAPHCVF